MGLGLERDYSLEVLDREIVGAIGVHGIELVDNRPLHKCHIILVGRHQSIGVLLRGLLDELKERHRLFLAVDNESAVENLVTAVLGVNLREAEHLRVGQGAPQLLGQGAEVFLLVGAESEALPEIVFMDVVDMHYGFGLAVNGEYAGVDSVVDTLKHLVEYRLGSFGYTLELLDAADARHTHVLGNLHGVGAPGGDHLAAGAYESPFYGCGAQRLGSGECP